MKDDFILYPPADRWRNAYVLVTRIGARALKVVESVAKGRRWKLEDLRRGADVLESGVAGHGVARPWPHLAARVRKVAEAWAKADRRNPAVEEVRS